MDDAKIRVVGYVRVSTAMQADEGVSLEAQKLKIHQYAALYDLELVCIIEDAGVSAKTIEREGLQKALATLKNGEADALLVVKLDRLTRSIKDLGTLIDSYFNAKAGLDLMVVEEKVDTRSASGRLVLNVLMSVAQWEREAIGERTSAAMRHKAMNNEYTGGRVPYGWSLDTDGTSLIPAKDEQKAIRYANKLRDKGMSLRQIGELLSKRGLYPKGGKKWYASSVKRAIAGKLAA